MENMDERKITLTPYSCFMIDVAYHSSCHENHKHEINYCKTNGNHEASTFAFSLHTVVVIGSKIQS